MKKLSPPDVKVPKTLIDLYYDLRDRRLLPLVALLLVAIVAAPILLSGKGDDEPSDATVPQGQRVSPDASAEGSTLTVVKVDPGIRNPQRRLAGRRAKNPFVRRGTGSGSGSGGATPDVQTPTTTTTTTTATGTTGSSSASPPVESISPPVAPTTSTPTESDSTGSRGGNAKGGNPTPVPPVKDPEGPAIGPPSAPEENASPGHLTLFAFEIEVRITKRAKPSGTGADSEGAPVDQAPVVKSGVQPATPLPGTKQPVVTYMGTKDGKTPLLMISNEVSEVLGEGKCLSGTGNCQLIAVEPGEPEILVFGPNQVRYKIEVLGIEPVVTGHM